MYSPTPFLLIGYGQFRETRNHLHIPQFCISFPLRSPNGWLNKLGAKVTNLTLNGRRSRLLRLLKIQMCISIIEILIVTLN